MTVGEDDLGVAVVGMACRVPGAVDVDTFWANLRDGVESISFFEDDVLRESGVTADLLAHSGFVRAGAILEDPDSFEASFFGIGVREAQALDPQHRLFMEQAWVALEDAGYDPGRYRGSIGVFGGAGRSAHHLRILLNPALREAVSAMQGLISTGVDFLATRVAYALDLRGPAVTVQTACSTSLSAVHLACQSLLAGECDMALAGGVSLSLPQETGYVYEPDGILSRDGHCRAFDAEATGTVKGNGVGVVVLKRLPDARRDRDHVRAVIRGWAMNNDAANRVGFTAPGVAGQSMVVRMAMAMASVEPESIGYIEAHGTGTPLGDPIEIAALTQVLSSGASRPESCAIGSVKTNIGHLDSAAGVAGLVKVVLMLQHREMVPSLHYRSPNPQIDFGRSPLYVNTRTGPWPESASPRRAGISSFGIGGTNVHLVLEEAPPEPARARTQRTEVLKLSARSAPALDRVTDDLVAHLRRHPELDLGDVAFTRSVGRRGFRHRRAAVVATLSEAEAALATRDPRTVWTGTAPEEGRSVAFLFSGQGSQYVDMGRGLYDTEPVYRAEVDTCAERLRDGLGLDLRGLLHPERGDAQSAAARLDETRFTQPALFVVEYALARLWSSWGVEPEAMLGHSIGEYVAACLAGVMSFDDALLLVAERGRLMQACPRGAMLAVALGEDAVRPLLVGSLGLSAVNGPDACVVGGPVEEIARLSEALEKKTLPHTRLATSHAFHTGLMAPALDPFAALLARVRLSPPRIPFVSNVTGTWIRPEEATDPAYWTRHLASTVRFAEGLAEILREADRVLLELGPGSSLTALARRRFPRRSPALALQSLRHPREAMADGLFIRQTAARLWTAGADVDLTEKARGHRRVVLPTYPFERQSFSIEAPALPAVRPTEPSRVAGVAQWLHSPSWKRLETSPEPPAGGDWCVFAGGPRGDAVVERLRADGANVSVVRPGPVYARRGERDWQVDPLSKSDNERLFDELEVAGGVPARLLHLWGMEGAIQSPSRDAAFALVDPLFESVLGLGQALGPRQDRRTTLTVVTSGVQDVTGSELLSPPRSTVLGLLRVMPQEYPLLVCSNLDVEEATDAREIVRQARILASPGAPDTVVACRGPYRWAESFEPLATTAAESGRLRKGGVYLITGGLGKVGLALAEHLARSAKARLVLTGRSRLPEPALRDAYLGSASADDATADRIRAVRALEALGSEVLVVKADVADRAEMESALRTVRERFGTLNGVIHAAGDLGSDVLCPVAQLEASRCERQLRPKAGGVEVLDAVLADEPLDFVLLTSSLSTVLGGLGFSAYAAANQYLDTFARRQHRRGRRWWTSVGWDGWQFASAPTSREGASGIRPAEGGEALDRILGVGPVPQVIVSTSSLRERLERWTLVGPLQGEGAAERPSSEQHPRPELGTVYVSPEDAVDRRLAEIWGRLLGLDRVGLDDNFFELGGTSLLAVHMMGRLKSEFSVALSVPTLFEAPTVRALGQKIRVSGRAGVSLVEGRERGELRRQARGRRPSDAAVE